MATLKLDDADGARAVSAAKAAIAKYAKQVGESAVQVHGGIGMTDELNVGHHFKRLTLCSKCSTARATTIFAAWPRFLNPSPCTCFAPKRRRVPT